MIKQLTKEQKKLVNFRIGDRVVFIRNDYGDSFKTVGSEATVIGFEEDGHPLSCITAICLETDGHYYPTAFEWEIKKKRK